MEDIDKIIGWGGGKMVNRKMQALQSKKSKEGQGG